MASFNKVLLMGNLTRDPELSYTPQGLAVCKFGLAVNNSYTTASGEKKEDPLFIDIVVWKKQGENCATYLKKGRPVFVEGRLQLDNWTTQTGEKRSKMKVIAMSVRFLGSKPSAGAGAPAEDRQMPEEDKIPAEHSDPEGNEAGEEDIPF